MSIGGFGHLSEKELTEDTWKSEIRTQPYEKQNHEAETFSFILKQMITTEALMLCSLFF